MSSIYDTNRVSTKQNLIYLIVIVSIILLIKKVYQTQLTTKTYLLNVYLYIFLAFFSIVVGALNFMDIVPYQKQQIMLLFLFLITIPIMSTIFIGNQLISHIGFGLFILIEALVFAILFKNLTININTALIITSILFVSFSLFVYYSSDEMILMMANWQNYLLILLVIVIIVQFLLTFLKPEVFMKYQKYYYYLIIILFIGFILSDTSRQAYRSKVIVGSQYNVNYPSEVMSLLLDYLNMFSATLQVMNNN